MKRLPWILLAVLFLIGDLGVAGFVYDRLDPGAARAALRRFGLSQQTASAPAVQSGSTSPTGRGRVSPASRLLAVKSRAWRVDKWQPSTRLEMGVGDGVTWPVHGNARQQYLVLTVYEANRAGSRIHVTSSARHFELADTNKIVYRETQVSSLPGTPPRMREFKDLPPGGRNVGGIAFGVPVHRGTYKVRWKASTVVGWVTVASVSVGPGHRPIVSPSS